LKKHKYLLAAGCSFVQGSCMFPLDDPRHKKNPCKDFRFSKIMANGIGAEEINFGTAGGSNQRAFRRIYEWTRENPSKVKDTFFVVGVTSTGRQEKFLDGVNRHVWFHQFFPDRELSIPRSVARDVRIYTEPFIDDLILYNKLEYKFFFNEKNEHERLLRKADLLQSYIRGLGSEILFFNAFQPSFVTTNASDKLDDRLNWYKPGGYDTWPAFISSYRKYQFDHPLFDDHEILGKDLVKHYESIK
jgi:hypothetical protein